MENDPNRNKKGGVRGKSGKYFPRRLNFQEEETAQGPSNNQDPVGVVQSEGVPAPSSDPAVTVHVNNNEMGRLIRILELSLESQQVRVQVQEQVLMLERQNFNLLFNLLRQEREDIELQKIVLRSMNDYNNASTSSTSGSLQVNNAGTTSTSSTFRSFHDYHHGNNPSSSANDGIQEDDRDENLQKRMKTFHPSQSPPNPPNNSPAGSSVSTLVNNDFSAVDNTENSVQGNLIEVIVTNRDDIEDIEQDGNSNDIEEEFDAIYEENDQIVDIEEVSDDNDNDMDEASGSEDNDEIEGSDDNVNDMYEAETDIETISTSSGEFTDWGREIED